MILNKKYIRVAPQKFIFTSEYVEVRQFKFSLLLEILALFVLLWAIRQAPFFLYHDNMIVHPRYYDISKIVKICWSLYLFFKGFFSQFMWRMNHQWWQIIQQARCTSPWYSFPLNHTSWNHISCYWFIKLHNERTYIWNRMFCPMWHFL